MNNIFGETEITTFKNKVVKCETLHNVVEFLYKSSNFRNQEEGDLMRWLGRLLEQNIKEDEVYIYRNYVRNSLSEYKIRKNYKLINEK